MKATCDGLPVAHDKPFAAAVVVWRRRRAGREYLVLHRAHQGPDYEGDWAWTSPAGARQPGEEVRAAASRELREETGLDLEVNGPLEHVTDEVALFEAEAPADAVVRIDEEHDRFDWVSLEQAMRRCLPDVVAEGFRIVDLEVSERDVSPMRPSAAGR